MATVVLADAEGAVRHWIRDLADPDIGRNVYLGFPRPQKRPDRSDAPIPYPIVIVQRVAGTIDGYVDVDDAEIQLDVYGRDRRNVCAIAMRLIAAVNGLACGTPMGDRARAGGGRVVLGPLFRPDDEREVSRYLVGARFSLIPV